MMRKLKFISLLKVIRVQPHHFSNLKHNPMKKLIFILYLFIIFTFSCTQEPIVPNGSPCPSNDPSIICPPTAIDPCPAGSSPGSADFSKFVAIGNSLTAGYQSGSLFNAGQANSFPKILANKFECVGGSTTFNQPDINSVNGYYGMAGATVLGRLLLQGTPPAPTPTISDNAAIPNPSINPSFMYGGNKAALNNFGVPGILLGQVLIPQTGDWTLAGADPRFNPYYGRFASNPGTSTILTDAITALANGGTFFLFWLGNNDVLGYAVGGGSNPALLTSTANFTAYYNAAISGLLSVPNVKGVVGNIPNVTAIPYFTTIPYNGIPLDEPTVGLLNNGFLGYNSILNALKGPPFNLPAADVDKRKVTFVYNSATAVNGKTNNSMVIVDETLPSYAAYFDALLGAGMITQAQRDQLVPYEQIRMTTSTDLVTLSAGAVLGKVYNGIPTLLYGLTWPLEDKYILIPSETLEIGTRTAEFNSAISTIVANSSNRIALADVNTSFNQLLGAAISSKGMVVDGVTINPVLAPPTGIFSEDGVHPNNRGSAYMANLFIDAINSKFGASIPHANLQNYGATALPINP